jgi:pilus assembly protein Flp/PilA
MSFDASATGSDLFSRSGRNREEFPANGRRPEWGRVMRSILQFLSDRSAATSIEYAMIAAGVSIVVLAAVTSLGSSVSTTFTSVTSAIK